MKSFRIRSALRGLVLGGAVLLAGCNGVGEGILPVSATMLPTGGALGDTTAKGYSCLATSVSLIVTFSNGARGDFSSRATWSSSNNAVARVSNGDLEVPGQAGSFYSRGVIRPLSAGTAVITARYLDFTSSITLTVTDPSNFRITPAEVDLAVGSVLDLAATADLDGKSNGLDSFVVWSFVTPNDAVATILSSTGTITGKAASTAGPLMAQAEVPGCAALRAQVPVNVSPLKSIALSKEFTDTTDLVVNTTERITATGTLENGKTQDLSGQAVYASSDAASLSFLAGTLRSFIFASKASSTPVKLTASLGSVTTPAESALSITPVDATLANVLVVPSTATVAPGGTTQLKATGEYASGRKQDITRHIVWSTADATIATVQSSATAINPIAGLVLVGSAVEAGKTVVITGTNSNATGQKSATTTITVQATTP